MEKRWGEGGTPRLCEAFAELSALPQNRSVRFSLEPPRTRSVRITRTLVQNRFEQSRVIQHQNLTFCNNANFFRGRAKRVPLISPRQILSARRAQARLAVGQDEVRAKDFFGSNLFCKKITLPCDFRQIFCFFYPFRHRFEPASPLLFNPCHLLFQRLLFTQ